MVFGMAICVEHINEIAVNRRAFVNGVSVSAVRL